MDSRAECVAGSVLIRLSRAAEAAPAALMTTVGAALAARSENGAPGRSRTGDLPLRRGKLYPLSYRGVVLSISAQRYAGARFASSVQAKLLTV